MAHAILIAVYVLGAGLELVGLKLTAGTFIVNTGQGVTIAPEYTAWQRRRGPVLIAFGIGFGFAGNIASTFVFN